MNDVEMLQSITRIYGVDFSGASDAGRQIWISTGVAKDDKLQIEECGAAYSLPGSGKDLKQCIIALLRFVRSQRSCAIGFDFPFSLPTSLPRT